MGNFSFLLKNDEYESFSKPCIEAENMIATSTVATAFMARRALEQAVHWIYSHDSYLEAPYRATLSSLVWDDDFRDIVDSELHKQIVLLIRWGNHAAHGGEIKEREAILALHHLYQFVNFIDYCYSNEFVERYFDEKCLPLSANIKYRETPQSMIKLQDSLPELPDFHEQMAAQSVEVQETYTEKRETAAQRQDVPFHIDQLSEAETRKLFIDIDLRLAGWIFGENCRVEIAVDGLKHGSGIGYCDYVLYGKNGKILAIVEAKKASVNPEVGEVQVKEYAEALEKHIGYQPICFITNGLKHYILDGPNRRQIAGFYSQEELQLVMDRRHLQKPLEDISSKIRDDISGRHYQKHAIASVCEAFSNHRRQALLVMATGAGKTRTAVSLVDILSRHNWVKNVLFLADRTSLVKQAYDSFRKLLPDLSVCNFLEDKEGAQSSRMVFSTYPTMIGAISGQEEVNQRPFTVGHFDLIIIDESHRSIYQKYKSIFDYFDARIVGLTATPRQDLDKNTYGFFNLENGVPTYAYDLEEAVKDGYLVAYHSIETKLKLPTDGLHYDDLSEEEKEHFDSKFEDDSCEKDIDGSVFNSFVFNKSTVEIVLNELMTRGIQTASGDEIGKTIIFAKNHDHAEYIRGIFNNRYPEKGSDYAQVIDYSIKHYQTLIDDFKIEEKYPQIAISVDMLDTGIDVPEVVNLVFFKKVRSKTKFWQMIGRGTRLCKDLFGPEQDKENFLVFDYGDNFDYFRADPRDGEGRHIVSLTQRLFNIKVDLIRELQGLQYQEDQFARAYRQQLVSELQGRIESLNELDFRVRMVLDTVYSYRKLESWQNLTAVTSETIQKNLSPLLFDEDKEDEMARRFDLWLLHIQLGQLTAKSSTVHETTAFLQVNDLRSYNEKVEHYLKTHLDEESISKLYHNKKLTSDDMLALEKLLWEKLGSKADYQSHYENKAIPRLVREIIGLDRESANRIFSKFLSDENLNARQISFVKLIVDYIVENGFLETKVLTQEPFKSYGSVQLLFQHQLPVLRNIVQIIELINNRAGEAA
ncbi:TPA: DEAD/DEAH box helicase family protein [Streptococcus pneumoniae]|nr:DEAD/DEAH box helicase family protein [Streptococcus pneumoniae]